MPRPCMSWSFAQVMRDADVLAGFVMRTVAADSVRASCGFVSSS